MDRRAGDGVMFEMLRDVQASQLRHEGLLGQIAASAASLAKDHVTLGKNQELLQGRVVELEHSDWKKTGFYGAIVVALGIASRYVHKFGF
jgi:hypothetical protein